MNSTEKYGDVLKAEKYKLKDIEPKRDLWSCVKKKLNIKKILPKTESPETSDKTSEVIALPVEATVTSTDENLLFSEASASLHS